ncbi:MAG: hypothetical protein CMJ89_01855 [Planctomycetes bacterium]|nr:hypothetical protein [Planctomycetota bacterium]
MLRTSLPALILALPAGAQWATIPHQSTNPVHTEGFLIVHDDGSDVMAFSALAQEWTAAAPGGSNVVGTGDFCALFKLPTGDFSAYSARLHATQVAPVPAGGNVDDMLVGDDVALLIGEDNNGDAYALCYSAQTNLWDLLSLGPVALSSLEYGADRFVAAVTGANLLAGFAARTGGWNAISNDSAQNLRFDGNVVVADVVPTPGSPTHAAAFSGVLGIWSVSPPTHSSNVTELDHNVAWAMMDAGLSTIFHQGAYSAYTGAWIVPGDLYLEGNWSAELRDNLVLLHDSLSDRYLAFGARPGNAVVAVPSSGSWSVALLTEDGVILDEIGTPEVYGFSGLCGSAFVPRSVTDPLAPIIGPSHSLHLRDDAGAMHSFGPAENTWAATPSFGASALLHVDDAVHLVEDGLQLHQYSTRHNTWNLGPSMFPGATYTFGTGGSFVAVQEDTTTSGDLRIYNEASDGWDGPHGQSARLDMHTARNLVMFVDTNTSEASAYSAQTTRYSYPPPGLTPGILAPGSVPTVEENVAWFTDGVSVVAFGSPGEIHSWHQWPRGTEYQVWAGIAPTTLDASIRTGGPHATFWLAASGLRPPLPLPCGNLFWLDLVPWWTIRGPQIAQPVGPGSVHLAKHTVALPGPLFGSRQVWTQGLVFPTGAPWCITDFFAEPAWIF